MGVVDDDGIVLNFDRGQGQCGRAASKDVSGRAPFLFHDYLCLTD